MARQSWATKLPKRNFFVLICRLQLAGRHIAETSRFWGSRFEAKNSQLLAACLSGKAPDCSGKDPLADLFVCSTQEVSPNRGFQFQKRCQVFIRVHNETFSLPTCVCNPDRCPAESLAATYPQLNPALLRLSAMLSQYFMRYRNRLELFC